MSTRNIRFFACYATLIEVYVLWVFHFRPQTSRSLSAGAVDKSGKRPSYISQKNDIISKESSPSVMMASTSRRGNNITELEVNSDFEAQPTTSTSSSTDTKSNITIIQVSTNIVNGDKTSTSDSDYEPPKLPHKSSNAEIFTFPEAHVTSAATTTKTSSKQHEYKSNVQIIPSCSSNSNNSSTIQVMGSSATTLQATTSVGNQYTTPVKKSSAALSSSNDEHSSKITTVHVTGTDNTYGTCFSTPSVTASSSTSLSSTPKLPKKIILSANTSGITNITVNNSSDSAPVALRRGSANRTEIENAANPNRSNSLHYEKVFLLSSSSPIAAGPSTSSAINGGAADIGGPSSSQKSVSLTPMSPKWNSPHRQINPNKSKLEVGPLSPITKSSVNGAVEKKQKGQSTKQNCGSPPQHGSHVPPSDQSAPSLKMSSPALQRRRIVSPSSVQTPTGPTPRPPFLLTRGLTEAVITARPSRRDFHFLNKLSSTKTKPSTQHSSANVNANSKSTGANSNNNDDTAGPSIANQTPTHMAINRTASDAVEQRRRSSSTSDAQAQRHSRGANNNEFSNRPNGGGIVGNSALRQPPQPFRMNENILGGGPGGVHSSTTSPAKRMTLREQQVMQLRREIMHPGGVRLQLRRKDCVGSIAWVDSFGAVW